MVNITCSVIIVNYAKNWRVASLVYRKWLKQKINEIWSAGETSFNKEDDKGEELSFLLVKKLANGFIHLSLLLKNIFPRLIFP